MIESPPYLIGSIPFPEIEGWRADAALCVRQNLRAKETASTSCCLVVEHLKSLPAGELVSTLLRPEVFLFLTMTAQTDQWAELNEALGARPTRRRDDSLIWFHPTPQFTDILRRQGRGSRRDSAAGASFIDPTTTAFAQYASAMERARLLIGQVAPGFREEIDGLVDCVVLADEGASFRGASGLAFRGMIMLSPDPSWTDGIFAEELVHETTHLLLDILSIREPLLAGEQAFEEMWAAPFRPDKRPLYGNFHALVVVSRLIHLFLAFERAGVEPEMCWSAKAQDYAQRSIEAIVTLKAYGNMSAMARRWLEQLVEPTLEATLATRSPSADCGALGKNNSKDASGC